MEGLADPREGSIAEVAKELVIGHLESFESTNVWESDAAYQLSDADLLRVDDKVRSMLKELRKVIS